MNPYDTTVLESNLNLFQGPNAAPTYVTSPGTASLASDLVFVSSNNLGSSSTVTVPNGTATGQRLVTSFVNKRHAGDVVLISGVNIAEVNLNTAGDTASFVWSGVFWIAYQLTGTAAYNI